MHFDDLEDLSPRQKDQVLLLFALLIDAAEKMQDHAYDSGDKGERLSILADRIGLVQLRHEINGNRSALALNPSATVSELLEPVLRYMRTAQG